MKITLARSILVSMLVGALAFTSAFAADAPKMKMSTTIPPGIEIAGQGGDPAGHAEVLRRLPG